jgi:hypothetical protein
LQWNEFGEFFGLDHFRARLEMNNEASLEVMRRSGASRPGCAVFRPSPA